MSIYIGNTISIGSGRQTSGGGEPPVTPTIQYIKDPYVSYTLDISSDVFTQLHVTGTVYGVAVPSASPTPSSTQIKDGQNSSGVAAPSASAIDSGKGVKLSFTGLTKSTSYKYCIYSEGSGDTFSSIKTITGSTISDIKNIGSPGVRINGSAVTVSGGTQIDGITDQFNNVYNFVGRADLTDRPIYVSTGGPNSTPIIRFDGTQRIMNTGAASAYFQDFSIYLVFKMNDVANRQSILTCQTTAAGSSPGLGWYIRQTLANTMEVAQVGSNGTTQSFTFSFTDTANWHVLHVRYNSIGTGTSLRNVELDGTSINSVSNLNTIARPVSRPLTLGGNGSTTGTNSPYPLNGDIADLILYNDYHTSAQKFAVYRDLNTRYGFTLPTS